VRQQPIYSDDLDRRRFLALLSEVIEESDWRCLTYCLMGNHYHLLVQIREPNLSTGMHRLNGEYARGFNARHEHEGHVFQGRFWSKMVQRDAHLLGLVRYIALNPVRANLCTTASDWPWSAHRALAGEEPAGFVNVAATLAYVDNDPSRARARYKELIAGEEPQAPAVDGRLRRLIKVCGPDEALVRAHLELGYPVAELAATFGHHPKTVRRRLAAATHVP
jgi:REP element-mobilizing transposase RayT